MRIGFNKKNIVNMIPDLSSVNNRLSQIDNAIYDINRNTGDKCYYIFPNGLKICWGTMNLPETKLVNGAYVCSKTINFPFKFKITPTVNYIISSGNQERTLEDRINGANFDSFTAYLKSDIAGYSALIYWFAIGY